MATNTDIQLSGNAEKALKVLPEVLRDRVYGEALNEGAAVLRDSINAAFRERFKSRSGRTMASSAVIPADEVYKAIALVKIGDGRGVARWLSKGTKDRVTRAGRNVGRIQPDRWIQRGTRRGRRAALSAFVREYDRRLSTAAAEVRRVK